VFAVMTLLFIATGVVVIAGGLNAHPLAASVQGDPAHPAAIAVLLAFPVAMALATGVEAPSSAIAQLGQLDDAGRRSFGRVTLWPRVGAVGPSARHRPGGRRGRAGRVISGSIAGHQAVADPGFGEDLLRLGAVQLERRPQRGDRPVDIVLGRAPAGGSERRAQQSAAGDETTGTGGQHLEHRALGRSELHPHPRRRRRVDPTDERVEAGDERRETVRRLEDVVGARFDGADGLAAGGRGDEGEERYVGGSP
jgi:hypothetical protein